jgi:hypothetical protein
VSRRDPSPPLAGRVLLLALVAAIVLALALDGPARGGTSAAGFRPAFEPAPTLSRVAGEPVLCSTSWPEWAALNRAWRSDGKMGAGFWAAPFVLLEPDYCPALRDWRRDRGPDSTPRLELALFTLAHEAGHARLGDSEAAADCYAVEHFQSYRHELGIERRLSYRVAIGDAHPCKEWRRPP